MTIEVINIPARDPDYVVPVSRSKGFETFSAAVDFAERNGGRLFYIRDGVWAFVNVSHRTPEEIQ